MTHLSLFSGIGGLDLAAEWAGFITVGQCEWADYPTKVLEKHWPNVPRWRDIRTLTKEDFFARTGLRTVDVVSGGFPCQPFSQAGKRRGKEDDRYLWPEMLRVIRELQPAWVVGENVPGIVSLALDEVLSDLEGEGYTCQPFIIPAAAVDAPHRRDRCAIVAYSYRERLQGKQQYCTSDPGRRWEEPYGSTCELCKAVPYTNGAGLPESGFKSGQQAIQQKDRTQHLLWWPAEPDVGRVADGVPKRVDRLKCLGNAVVPQQFCPFFQAIANVERGIEKLVHKEENE